MVWKERVRAGLTFLTSAMIAILFVMWALLGPSAVSKQNGIILEGVQTQLDSLEDDVSQLVRDNSVGDRVIVCLLNLLPEQRDEAFTDACVAAARAGEDHLSNAQVRELTHREA